MSRSRRLLFPLLFALLGSLLACGLLEAAVRVLGMDPPSGEPAFFWQDDARFGWYHIPGAAGYYFNPAGEYNAYARVNAAGLIDQDYAETRPDDVFRILVLGDSFSEGLRLPMDAAFHSLIERDLRLESGKQVEVINGGVAGWGTDQQVLFYREIGRRYQPDLVLVAFFPANDIMNNSVALESANFGGVKKPFFLLEDQLDSPNQLVLHNFPVGSEDVGMFAPASPTAAPPSSAPAPDLSALLQHSALYRYLVPRLRLAAPGLTLTLARLGFIKPGAETNNAAQGPDYIPVAYGVYRSPPDDAWEQGWALTAALLAALQAEVEADGGQLALLILPAQEQVEAGAWQRNLAQFPAMKTHIWDVTQPNRRLAAILDAQAIPYLDLLPDFQAWDGPGLFFPIDRHWNERGHALAAAHIQAWLAAAETGLAAPAR